MKKIVVQIVIFVMLYSGMSWATDSHDEAFIVPQNDLLTLSQLHTQHYIDFEYNDHGCHGSLHNTTLPADTSAFLLAYSTEQAEFIYLGSFHSLILEPPIRPPIV